MKPHPFAAVVICLAAVSGCARQVTIPSWQRSVETYIKQQGGGDPDVLRGVTWQGTHHGFSAISAARPENSTDAKGILLAHRMAGERPWFVFLVGLVERQKVKDIRIAALWVQGDKYDWRVGHKDAEALKAYRGYNDRVWRQRFPGRRDAPVEYLGFPREEDAFNLNIEGEQIAVNHTASGAQWELRLSKPNNK